LLCLLLLCFGRFVSLFFVAVAFGFALALLFDCFALGLLLGAWLAAWRVFVGLALTRELGALGYFIT
jgi:hypothetical protein